MKSSSIAFVVLVSLGAADRAEAQLLSRESYGGQCNYTNGDTLGAALSASGRWIAFSSTSGTFTLGDNNGQSDVFLRDRWTRETTCLSVNAVGVPGAGTSNGRLEVSPDARWVAFESSAANLVVGDTNAARDVFVRDLWNSSTRRVSVATGGTQSNGYCGEASMSDDGRFVVFTSQATNLVPDDGSSQPDVFLHDRDPDANGTYDEGNGATLCLSVHATTGAPVNAISTRAQISGDGAWVAFSSWSDQIVAGDANGVPDVFLWSRASGTTTILSVAFDGSPSNGSSLEVSLSADGHHASFASSATNLVAGGDGNATVDVYVRDLLAGTTELVSAGSGTDGAATSAISGDGRYVVFETLAQLVVGDTDVANDVYLHDRQLGATTLVTLSQGDCSAPAISADGGFVAWTSELGMLPSDPDVYADVYVLDRGLAPPPQTAFCFGDGTDGACPCGNAGLPGTGCAHSQGASARLSAYGSFSTDSIVLAAHGLAGNALTVFLQGDATIAPLPFGDGLRCVGGHLVRLNLALPTGSSAYWPACPYPASIRWQSEQLGDPIAPGSTRHYMAYYRDPAPSFCAEPAGSTFNASNAVSLTW